MWIYGLSVIGILLSGYFLYGKFLENIFEVKNEDPVPSKDKFDNVDYVPTNKWVLLGHHFSSIAGAGPIVGPILAGLAFGWVPAIFWILIGSIFIGGVHDFASLVISLRHEGRSVAEIASRYISKRAYYLLLTFIWLALMYVIAVFTDLAADSFNSEPVVAQISLLYILVALLFGPINYYKKLPLWLLTLVALIIVGFAFPLSFKFQFLVVSKDVWVWVLLLYALVASILPVWLLLQPRDYLSSYLLYISVIVGVVGFFLSGSKISFEPVKTFTSTSLGPMVPFLFITIACGAISGFHSLVASGTTSKQLDNFKNSRFVAYGGMLLEGLVAAVALSTLMILSSQNMSKGLTPAAIYAEGFAKYISIFGVKNDAGKALGLLILSAFILTTLDTATRISRYVFQELIGKAGDKSFRVRVYSTLLSLILPVILLKARFRDPSGNLIPSWKIIWPIFGTTNQLLAALVLTVIFVWARKKLSKGQVIFVLPMVFMLVMTVSALIWLIAKDLVIKSFTIVTVIAFLLLILAIVLSFESLSVILRKK